MLGDIHPEGQIFKYFVNLSKQNINSSGRTNLWRTDAQGQNRRANVLLSPTKKQIFVGDNNTLSYIYIGYCIVLYYSTGVSPLFPTRKLEERTHPERQGHSKRQGYI